MPTNHFKVEVSKEAEIDFDASYEYYLSNSPKVANRFYKTINNDLKFISKNPFAFPDVFNGVRKFVVHKFPFVIYYQISQNTIKVIAIFHAVETLKYGKVEYRNSRNAISFHKCHFQHLWMHSIIALLYWLNGQPYCSFIALQMLALVVIIENVARLQISPRVIVIL